LKAATGKSLVSKKVGLLPESVIREMTRLASIYGAINLAQGFPDFPAPPQLKKAAMRAIKEDHNQYEVTAGSPELREALGAKLGRVNRIRADPETEITVMCGSTEALLAAVLALTDRDDEIVIHEPFYENYGPAAVISGARARYVRLLEPAFELDEEELKMAFNSRTRAIIINTPNNPSGRVFTEKELGVIADLCEDYDCVAITDEIYEQIVYRGNKHVSLATVKNMADRTVTICGFSKTYSVTGWRIGYAAAEKHLTQAIRTVHDFITVCAPAPLQRAAIEALSLPESYYKQLVQSYTKKRAYMLRSLSSLGFNCVEPQGAYYILADFEELSKKDDSAFAEDLVKQPRVAVVPGSSFYSTQGAGRKMVRFAFPKMDETLREATARLSRALG
jgi:aspartate/methionine/tyrosine aminotransferase